MSFVPGKTVILDIDTINAFMKEGGALYKPETEVIKPNLAMITQLAFRYGTQILSFCDKHYGDSEHGDAETELKVNGGPFELHAEINTEWAEKIPETLLDRDVVYIPTDLTIKNHTLKQMLSSVKQIIVEKQALNCFHDDDSNPGGNPVLYQILDVLNIQNIFVQGVYTEYCVKENVMPFLVMGTKVWIIKDAIVPYNINPNEGNNALVDLANMGARFMNTDDFARRFTNLRAVNG